MAEHFLALRPDPHGQGALRPTFLDLALLTLRGPEAVTAWGWARRLVSATLTRIEEEHLRPDYVTTHPEHVNQLLAHLLFNTETLDSSSFDLARIIRRLRNQLGQEQIAPLLNQALRLGIEGI